jgi:hypothetical protein
MTTSIIPEFSAQSRFLFVEAPLQQLPHNCASCRRYDRPEPERDGHLKLLDFNVEIEFFGKIFICEDCLREIVNQLGWADEYQVKQYNGVKADLLEQVALLSEENENLRNAVGNLSSVAARPSSPGVSVVVPVESSEELSDREVGDAVQPDVLAQGVAAGINYEPDGAAGTNEGPVEPDDEPGPTDLRGDVDVDQLLADL